MFWRKAVRAIAETHVSALREAGGFARLYDDELEKYVLHSINRLPWFYRLPVKGLAVFHPSSATLNRLIRSVTYLAYFDRSVR